MVAAGSVRSVKAQVGHAFQSLQTFIENETDWIFGHLSYDLKNEIEFLYSAGNDGIKFPDLFFFVPEFILQLDETSLTIGSFNHDHETVFDQIMTLEDATSLAAVEQIKVKSRLSKEGIHR